MKNGRNITVRHETSNAMIRAITMSWGVTVVIISTYMLITRLLSYTQQDTAVVGSSAAAPPHLTFHTR